MHVFVAGATGVLGTRLVERLDAPSPLRVPGWLAGLFVGREHIRMVTTPSITSNDRFCRAFEWKPGYPTYREGPDEVVER